MDAMEHDIWNGLSAMGIEASAEQCSALAEHVRLVYQANRELNLTRIPYEQAVTLHVLDSAAALPFLMDAPGECAVDLGSGAGFPGIPLAVLSGRRVDLAESVRKKAAFLERAVGVLRLNSTVHPIRAEQLAHEQAGAYGAVVARALSSLPSLVELASPLLVRDGCLICLKGDPEAEELERGDAVASRCGMKHEETLRVQVPRCDAARTIVTYRRTGRASISLPRREGLAQRQPLA